MLVDNWICKSGEREKEKDLDMQMCMSKFGNLDLGTTGHDYG